MYHVSSDYTHHTLLAKQSQTVFSQRFTNFQKNNRNERAVNQNHHYGAQHESKPRELTVLGWVQVPITGCRDGFDTQE